MSKRYVLLTLTNLAVVMTISLIAAIFGAKGYVEDSLGINYGVLIAVCTVWGFGAAFISLLLSRIIAKRFLGVTIIPADKPGNLQWLSVMTKNIARGAGLPEPEVGIYRSSEANAFATGPSQSKALVAFSTKLIESMDKEAIEGVVAHEVAHIKNGDMVTMTLIQGVINVFVLFFAHLIAYAASQAVKDRAQRIVWTVTIVLAEFVLGLVGLMIAGTFSRKREFRADAGSARMVGHLKMVKALKYLTELKKSEEEAEGLPAPLAALGVSGKSRIFHLLSTHPTLEKRIEYLEKHITV